MGENKKGGMGEVCCVPVPVVRFAVIGWKPRQNLKSPTLSGMSWCPMHCIIPSGEVEGTHTRTRGGRGGDLRVQTYEEEKDAAGSLLLRVSKPLAALLRCVTVNLAAQRLSMFHDAC